MYFRFVSALLLVGLISLAGITLEKRILDLRRRISRQHFELDVLRDRRVRLRMEVERQAAPSRTIDEIHEGTREAQRP